MPAPAALPEASHVIALVGLLGEQGRQLDAGRLHTTRSMRGIRRGPARRSRATTCSRPGGACRHGLGRAGTSSPAASTLHPHGRPLQPGRASRSLVTRRRPSSCSAARSGLAPSPRSAATTSPVGRSRRSTCSSDGAGRHLRAVAGGRGEPRSPRVRGRAARWPSRTGRSRARSPTAILRGVGAASWAPAGTGSRRRRRVREQRPDGVRAIDEIAPAAAASPATSRSSGRRRRARASSDPPLTTIGRTGRSRGGCRGEPRPAPSQTGLAASVSNPASSSPVLGMTGSTPSFRAHAQPVAQIRPTTRGGAAC